jgi:hypothetical protein
VNEKGMRSGKIREKTDSRTVDGREYLCSQ